MKFPNTGYLCLLLGVTEVALVSANSNVLMLDSRNLRPEKEHFGHGEDYSVSLAKDADRAPLPSQFTICNSNFMLGVGEEFWFYQIMNQDFTGTWLSVYGWADSSTLEKYIGFVVNGYWIHPGHFGSLYFNTWYHLCLAIDLDRDVLSFVGDGFVLDYIEVMNLGSGAPKSLDGHLILDSSWLTRSNYMAGNVQVFNGRLSNEEMISITAGKDCGRDGNYLAWKDMVWDVRGKVNGWVNVTMDELCASKTFRFVNTQASTFYYHKDFCTKMDRSRIPAPVDEPNMKDLLDYYRNAALELKGDDNREKEWTPHVETGRCVFYWIAYEFRQGVWVDHYTQEPTNYFNWGSFGAPANTTLPGSCVFGEANNASKVAGKTHHGGGGQWTAQNGECTGYAGMCAMCEKSTQPMLRLRGLCEDSHLSDLFTPVNDEKGTLGYAGLGRTVSIAYNASTLMWSTNNLGYSDVLATNPASLASGLLGTSEWTVYNDSRKCSLTSSYKIMLTFAACQKHEFTCVDAICIPMESRLNDCSIKYNAHVQGLF